MSGLTDPQPSPQNVGAAIVPMVIEDLTARREFGRKKYGDELRVTNGRDALVDAYQEALDLVIYLRQKIEQERKPGLRWYSWVCINGHRNDHARLAPGHVRMCATKGCEAEAEEVPE